MVWKESKKNCKNSPVLTGRGTIIPRPVGNGFSHGKINLAVLLLIVAVTLSSCCLLWFMNQAVQSERLAVRQRLIDTYRESISSLIEKSKSDWQQTLTNLKSLTDTSNDDLINFCLFDTDKEQPMIFASGLLIYDDNREILWPVDEEIDEESETNDDTFEQAHNFEFRQNDYTAAIKEYAGIIALSDNDKIKTEAMIGEARCLQKNGLSDKAIEICRQAITLSSEDDDLQNEIFLGRLLVESNDANAKDYVDNLLQKGCEKNSSLSLSKRILLLTEAINLSKEIANKKGNTFYNPYPISLLAALEKSLEFSEREDAWNFDNEQITQINEELYGLKIKNKRSETAVILFDKSKIINHTFAKKYSDEIPTAIFCKLYDGKGKYAGFCQKQPEGNSLIYLSDENDGIKLLELSGVTNLDNWRVDIFLGNDKLFAAAAKQRTLLYLYLGLFTVITFGILASSVIIAINRQTKANKLKNNFIATVTHELKTPLASTRMLIDTILEGRVKDAQTQTEYLEIISRENIRLTRLIDNFLAFSRMERNRNAFSIQPVQPDKIAQRGAEVLKTKFEQTNCKFTLNIQDNLPLIDADFDAMVTVITNLLDNACKYSKVGEGEKRIELSVYADSKHVYFKVEDNGIGMSAKQTKKIFERFYQVDQKLNRKAEGCGLGLSIVKFILNAHNATIEVESKPNIGSCFIVKF
ncbi:MAG: ATP-binding protein [Sedimentisphaeraceae bacterium JB056]